MDMPMQTRLAPVGSVDTPRRAPPSSSGRAARACSATTGGTTSLLRGALDGPGARAPGRVCRAARRSSTRTTAGTSGGVLGVVENATVGERRGPRHGALLRARRGETHLQRRRGRNHPQRLGRLHRPQVRAVAHERRACSSCARWTGSPPRFPWFQSERMQAQGSAPSSSSSSAPSPAKSSVGDPADPATTRKDPSMNDERRAGGRSGSRPRSQQERREGAQGREAAAKVAAEAAEKPSAPAWSRSPSSCARTSSARSSDELIAAGTSSRRRASACSTSSPRRPARRDPLRPHRRRDDLDETVNRRAAHGRALLHRADPQRNKLEERRSRGSATRCAS
jgi:hypothetical protein